MDGNKKKLKWTCLKFACFDRKLLSTDADISRTLMNNS